jgi:hypothetical protein
MNLCSKLLHDCLGSTTASCSIRLQTEQNVPGTLGPLSITAKAGRFWSTRSKAIFTAAKGKLSPTSIALPPPQSNLAQEVTKDPYNFDFLELLRKFCSNWESGSHSSAANIR